VKSKIINSIVTAYKNGKLSKNMVQFKKEVEEKLGTQINALAFATYIYDNEINVEHAAVAGEAELANAFAYFSQEAMGGQDGAGSPFWLKVWDSDTRLNYGGKPVELNELSHIINLNQWKEDIAGHLKHDPDSVTKLNNEDAKFDFDNGSLFLKMNPEEKHIHEGLRSGIIKPSIEVGFPDYMYNSLTNKLKSYSKVKGLGLMEDGKQMGLNVGPRVPNETALGGKDMADETGGEPTETEKFQTELKSEMDKNPKTVVEKKDEYLKQIDTLKIEGEFKTAFELFLEKNKPEVKEEIVLTGEDALKEEIKTMALNHQKEMETLKAMLEDNQQKSKVKDEAIAKIEKDMIQIELKNAERDGIASEFILEKEDMSLDEVKAKVSSVLGMKKAFLEGVPEKGMLPFIKKVNEPKKDGKGNISEEYFEVLDKGLAPTGKRSMLKPLPGYEIGKIHE